MAYSTADLDAIIAQLEASLSKGYLEVSYNGQQLTYRSTAEIERAIGYFKRLYASASDAQSSINVRNFYLYGGNR